MGPVHKLVKRRAVVSKRPGWRVSIQERRGRMGGSAGLERVELGPQGLPVRRRSLPRASTVWGERGPSHIGGRFSCVCVMCSPFAKS